MGVSAAGRAEDVIVGPLGGILDGVVVDWVDGLRLVSDTVATGALRLSDANPCVTLLLFADPGGAFAREVGVSPGRAELFDDGLVIASVSPGSWLAVSPGRTEDLVAQLLAVGADDEPIIIERSAGLSVLRLTGPSAPLVLNASTDHDLGSQRFPDGQAMSATPCGVRALVLRDDVVPEELGGAVDGVGVDLVPSYLLVCERSLARDLWEELLRIGEPWGAEAEGHLPYRARHRDV